MPKRKAEKSEKKEEGTSKRKRDIPTKVESEPVNKTDTNYSEINFSCDKKDSVGNSWNFKISSWNVVSMKALAKKKGFQFVDQESPDIICFQETKCSEKNIPPEAKFDGYHRYFVSGEKEGYAGVALYSKIKPITINYGLGKKEFDSEGRVITAEYDKFFLVTAYVPNSGRGLVTLPKRLKWNPVMEDHLVELDKKKPVIFCGDLNVAHNPIDLKNPTTNTKTAGFTVEERADFTKLLSNGFVDSFRHFYPQLEGAYTFWNYIGNARSRNVGWRIDYFVVSERFMPSICDSVIRKDVYGSDHCPITLFLHA